MTGTGGLRVVMPLIDTGKSIHTIRNQEPHRQKTQRIQARERYAKHRERGIEYLGGHCVVCFETNPTILEFDHIDPKTKVIDMKKLWKNSWANIMTELPKCQLLCIYCHEEKSANDREQSK